VARAPSGLVGRRTRATPGGGVSASAAFLPSALDARAVAAARALQRAEMDNRLIEDLGWASSGACALRQLLSL